MFFDFIKDFNYKAIIVTVDRPVGGKRVKEIEKNVRGSVLPPPKIFPEMNWNDLLWLKSITKLPIIAKGIQRYEDAKIAASLGIHVWVSNHGGR